MPEFGHAHHFGDSRYDDFTTHKDPRRAEAYRARSKSGAIDDVHAPAALSYYVLWAKPTLAGGIKSYEKKFGVDVVDRTHTTYTKK